MAQQNFSNFQYSGQSSLWGRLALFFIIWTIISFGFLQYRQQSGIEEIPYSVFNPKWKAVKWQKLR